MCRRLWWRITSRISIGISWDASIEIGSKFKFTGKLLLSEHYIYPLSFYSYRWVQSRSGRHTLQSQGRHNQSASPTTVIVPQSVFIILCRIDRLLLLLLLLKTPRSIFRSPHIKWVDVNSPVGMCAAIARRPNHLKLKLYLKILLKLCFHLNYSAITGSL